MAAGCDKLVRMPRRLLLLLPQARYSLFLTLGVCVQCLRSVEKDDFVINSSNGKVFLVQAYFFFVDNFILILYEVIYIFHFWIFLFSSFVLIQPRNQL